MFQIIPKDETRFWRIFRCLLIPVGLFSLLICSVAAIATLTGHNTPTINDEPVRGWRGVFLCLALFPISTFVFTLGITCFQYVERRIKSLFKR